MGDRNFFRRVFFGGGRRGFFWIDFFLECFLKRMLCDKF
jgi:hypothetical protein